MKKALIAGAASLAIAAMPIVGAFAADSSMSQTDIVKVTIDSACSLATSGADVTPDASTYTATIVNDGYNDNIAGSTFTVNCNDGQGWYLTAVGGDGETADNTMTGTKAGSTAIASLATPDIAANAESSNWAFKLTGATGATIKDAYKNFAQVPASALTVATGDGMSTDTKATVTAIYGVAIDGSQAADTYTGKVTYTLAHPKGTN